MITSDLPVEVASTDEAFASAITPKRFGDVVLEPYSLMRQMVAVEICGEDAHAVTQVIVHMWICTQKPDEVKSARKNRGRALEQAFEWAEAHGVRHLGTPAMDELIELYRQINDELRASTQLMPAAGNGDGQKKDGGRPA